MTTSDQRARDKDRDAAIELVEAAWADGQIIEVDRDKRVEQLLRARTLAEVEMLVHDLQRPSPATSPAAPPVRRPARSSGAPLLLLLPLLAVVAVLALVGLAVVGLADGDEDSASVSSAASAPAEVADPARPRVLSPQGYDDLVAAVRKRTGSSSVFMAVLYPTYAVVQVPVGPAGGREAQWTWDGVELTREPWKDTTLSERADLRRVPARLVADLVRKVRTKVEDPTSWYAVVRAPDDAGAVVWAYASNDFRESEHLAARRDGTITYDSTRG